MHRRVRRQIVPVAALIVAGVLSAPAVAASTAEPRWSPVLHFPTAGQVTVTGADLASSGNALVGLRMEERYPWSVPAVRARPTHRSGFRPIVRLGSRARIDTGPIVRLNARREAIAVWGVLDGDLIAARLPLGAAAWRPARSVGLPQRLGTFGKANLVALDDSGTARVVHVDCASDTACTVSTVQRARATAGWTRLPDLVIGDLSQATGRPRVAIGRQGDVLAAWPSATTQAVRAAVLRRGATAWSATETVSPTDPNPAQPSVAVGPAGDLAVGWSRSGPANTFGRRPELGATVALRRAGATAWQIAEDLAPTAQVLEPPSMALDAQGNVLAAWSAVAASGAGTLRTAIRTVDAAAFGAPATIMSSGEEESAPIAEVAIAAGRAFVFWDLHHGPGDNSVGASVRTVGGARWQPANHHSPTGYPEGAQVVAPNATALNVFDSLRVQFFDRRVRSGRPRAKRLVVEARGTRPVIGFTLRGRARVRAYAINVNGFRERGRVTAGGLSAGRHRVRLGALRPGSYRAYVRACTAARGCVDARTGFFRAG